MSPTSAPVVVVEGEENEVSANVAAVANDAPILRTLRRDMGDDFCRPRTPQWDKRRCAADRAKLNRFNLNDADNNESMGRGCQSYNNERRYAKLQKSAIVRGRANRFYLQCLSYKVINYLHMSEFLYASPRRSNVSVG